MLNRRAQLGWAFLILLVPALFAATYLVLLSFKQEYVIDSAPLVGVASDSLYSRRYAEQAFDFFVAQSIQESDPARFRESFEEQFVRLAAEHDLGDVRYGTFFKDITERRRYTLSESGGVYTLTMPGVQQTTREGNNVITRTFTLSVQFTRDGLL